jgi:pyroglutamyl-peptidase
MDDRLRILITGFGPFPGAPFNPTMKLVDRLTHLRRPAFDDVELASHIFHVTYATVDRELPQLLKQHRPHALLMFGLADRTHFLRVETRARNAVTTIFPDADGTRVGKGSIAADADAMIFGPHTAKLLRAALATGIDARASRDAGAYLCNYLSWRAIEATQQDSGPELAAFIHVPLLAHNGAARAPGGVTLEALVDAGEAMLLELVKLTRNNIREAARSRRPVNPTPNNPPACDWRSPRKSAFLR